MLGDKIFDQQYDWPKREIKKEIKKVEPVKADTLKAEEIVHPDKTVEPDVKQIVHRHEVNSVKSEQLEKLKAKIAQFKGFSFIPLAKNLVFADGSCNAPLMFIGEAPGEQEDELGKPFVGKSGKLLRYFLKELDLTEDDVYITNVVYWRPPGNRTPTDEEISQMRDFLFEHINIIAPKFIVPVGSVALKALGILTPITKAQGQIFVQDIAGKSRKIFPVYHPSYALRISSKKYDMWLSLLKLHQELELPDV